MEIYDSAALILSDRGESHGALLQFFAYFYYYRVKFFWPVLFVIVTLMIRFFWPKQKFKSARRCLSN